MNIFLISIYLTYFKFLNNRSTTGTEGDKSDNNWLKIPCIVKCDRKFMKTVQ